MARDQHDAKYYMKCMIGGMLACGLTHTAVVPLEKFKKPVTLGWTPTLTRYSLYGLGKFGFYDVYKKIVG